MYNEYIPYITRMKEDNTNHERVLTTGIDADPCRSCHSSPEETSTTKWHDAANLTCSPKSLAEPGNESHPRQNDKVAVPHGQGAIADYANVKMRLAQLPGAYVKPRNSNRTHRRSPYSSARTADDWAKHVVAVDVTHVQPNDTTITAATARSGERTTRSPKCRRMNRRKTRNRCWKARQPDSTGWTCADSHPTPAHAKPDRQPPPSRSACGTPGSVTARRARARRTGAWRLGSALHER